MQRVLELNMTDFTITNLNYSDRLLNDYQKLAKLPGFVFLDSSDKKLGRYDIVSAYPYHQYQVEQNSSSQADIFERLQTHLSPLKTNLDLPFQGGAIGYFSYDLGAQLSNIYVTPQANLQTMSLMKIGFYDWAIITDHWLKKVTLFAANTWPETRSITQEILALWNGDAVKDNVFKLQNKFTPLMSKSFYHDAFQAIHKNLKEGRCYQVNYTQPFNAAFSGDPWEMYKEVRLKNPVPYSAFLHDEGEDILSFSPERFLLHERDQLLTSPIKGSEKRSADPVVDECLRQALLGSEKNRAENIMIVDLLRNDLGKIAQAGSVNVKQLCEVQSFSAIHHLVSHIEAIRRNDISPLQAFKACFPGGSITGAPKLESMRVIAEQEMYARGVYCGSIAYFSNHGRFDSNIAIRTVVAKNEILHLAAGGGIVIDSHWEDEYCECFTKIAAILNGISITK